ncbi:hypothetical protein ACIBEF_00635 [Micromonospora sp. NPDC050795]|uniref:hypothetical protein n=1 Tax=Micromonospora sp. NPDC050795 TaxID=3364282 RepID=UPI003796B0EF
MTTDTDKFAPWPTEVDEVTADKLARSYTVMGWQGWTRWTATRGKDQSEADKNLREMCLHIAIDCFAVADVLRNVQIYAKDHADEIAKDVYAALDEGGAVGELLYDFLRSYGIDPAEDEWREEAVNSCVTCDLPEDEWPPFDLLFAVGSSKCPDCKRVDLNEQATRQNAER